MNLTISNWKVCVSAENSAKANFPFAVGNNQEQQQRLFAERDLYERTKKELNANIRLLKEVHLKENQDASLRLSSLQQVNFFFRIHQCESSLSHRLTFAH